MCAGQGRFATRLRSFGPDRGQFGAVILRAIAVIHGQNQAGYRLDVFDFASFGMSELNLASEPL